MPEVHRGYYRLEKVVSGFNLQHYSKELTSAEERDILMTELSLAFDTHPPPYPHGAFDRMIKAWPQLNGADVIATLHGSFGHYMNNLREPSLLSQSAYVDGFGFSQDEFRRVRAALMTLADSCLGMANAAERQRWASSRLKRPKWERECREWIAPLLTENFVIGTVSGLSGVPVETVDRVAAFFTMDAQKADFANAGEGYMPPFVRIGSSLLFSPYMLKVMLPERNVLYVLNKRDSAKFDQLVSSHLEPALIEESVEILSHLPGVQIKPNVKWSGGELDLLILQPKRKQLCISKQRRLCRRKEQG